MGIAMTDAGKPLKRTPLHGLHLSLGAKMVEFAGYDMPVQYPDGVLKEHLWTRSKAGLFDVSHMGQAFLKTTERPRGTEAAHAAVAAAIESLVPGEVLKLKRGAMRYSVLLNAEGGVLDDLMVTRPAMASGDGTLFLVVNAACKDADFALIKEKLTSRVELEILADRALIALQGPRAAAVIDSHFPGAGVQPFMSMRPLEWRGTDVLLSRCGYTGEDGFEISVPSVDAERLARALFGWYERVPALESVRRDRHLTRELDAFAKEEVRNRRRLAAEAVGPGGPAALAAALVDIDVYRSLRREGFGTEDAAEHVARLLNHSLDGAPRGGRR